MKELLKNCFIPHEIFTDTYLADAFYGRRRTDDVIRYLKKQPVKHNTGYNSRLEVKHFALSAVGVGQFATSSDVYLIFKHFEFIKRCFMS